MEFIWWQAIAVIAAITISFLLIVNSINKNRVKATINGEKGLIRVESTDGKEIKQYPEKMITAIKNIEGDKTKDFIILIHKTIDFMEKKHEIINSTIRDQMNTADLKMKQAETLINKIYMMTVIDEFGKSIDIMNEVSYIIFHNSSRIGLSETLMKMKQSFRENHFTDKSDYEFTEYIEEQANKIYYSLETLFNTQYLISLKPTKENLHIKLHDQQTTIKNILKDCFISAREIAAEKEKEIKELETNFEEECKNISNITNLI